MEVFYMIYLKILNDYFGILYHLIFPLSGYDLVIRVPQSSVLSVSFSAYLSF